MVSLPSCVTVAELHESLAVGAVNVGDRLEGRIDGLTPLTIEIVAPAA